MAQDICTIPTDELINDRLESLADIIVCEKALAVGVIEYSRGESTAERLKINKQIVEVIDAELLRRNAPAKGE